MPHINGHTWESQGTWESQKEVVSVLLFVCPTILSVFYHRSGIIFVALVAKPRVATSMRSHIPLQMTWYHTMSSRYFLYEEHTKNSTFGGMVYITTEVAKTVVSLLHGFTTLPPRTHLALEYQQVSFIFFSAKHHLLTNNNPKQHDTTINNNNETTQQQQPTQQRNNNHNTTTATQQPQHNHNTTTTRQRKNNNNHNTRTTPTQQ